MKNTIEIADHLVAFCRKGEFETAQKELYSDDAVSIEPYATPAFDKETKGLKAILEKGHKFDSMVEEMHGINVSDPLTSDSAIAIVMTMDITMKGRARESWRELCVYEVKDGKIISERFYM